MNPIVLGLALFAAPKALRALGLIPANASGGASGGTSPEAKSASSDRWLGEHLKWHVVHVDALLRQAATSLRAEQGPAMADALARAQEHLRAAAVVVKYGLTNEVARRAAPALGQRAGAWTKLRDAGKRRFTALATQGAAPSARASGPALGTPPALAPESGRPDLEVLSGGAGNGEWPQQPIGSDEDDPGLMGLT